MTKSFNQLGWHEVIWHRPFDFNLVQELLTHFASLDTRGPLIWEVRGFHGKVRYLFGSENQYCDKLKNVLTAHGNMQISDSEHATRKEITVAKELRISHPTLSLKTDNVLALARVALAAMAQTKNDEELALQIVLGPSFSPSPMPNKLYDPHATWLSKISGNVAPASPESRASYKEKCSNHGFLSVIRIGAGSESVAASNSLIFSLLSAFRILETAGVKIQTVSVKPALMDEAHVPWHFPLRLTIKELTNFFLLPVGDEELPGVAGLHPKLLLPPVWLKDSKGNQVSNFGVCLDSHQPTRLGITPRDSLEHTVILGPTGSGKSNVMLSLILENMKAGRSLLVIDPKADLVNDVLCRIPKSRENDVVVIDPSDSCPVGFNPFAFKHGNPELIADAILAVFKEIFADSWGVRSQDILSGALLTLAQEKDSSLVLLPTLLTDERFRKKITRNIDDKIGLEPFWAGFEAMGKAERNQVIAPVLNKMRQFILRPSLRNVLGQTKPKFSLEDLFNKRRIVLVSLNRGMIGAENARLLGSLIVGLTWTLALNRAKESPEKRHIVNIFIDELQDYLALPTDLSDALAQTRGLGVGLTLAHQYRSQLSPAIRAGIDANARNKIIFGLNAGDAKDLAAMAPELEAMDFMMLPRYRIYASLQHNGRNTDWISGKTLPPIPAFQSAAEMKAKSMERYGQDSKETEAEYLKVLRDSNESKQNEGNRSDHTGVDVDQIIGRKKKKP